VSVLLAPIEPELLVEPLALNEPEDELAAEPPTPPEYVEPGVLLLVLLELEGELLAALP